eukprot:Polyplicarium_translucidae@DN455_c0_g1_i1.p2
MLCAAVLLGLSLSGSGILADAPADAVVPLSSSEREGLAWRPGRICLRHRRQAYDALRTAGATYSVQHCQLEGDPLLHGLQCGAVAETSKPGRIWRCCHPAKRKDAQRCALRMQLRAVCGMGNSERQFARLAQIEDAVAQCVQPVAELKHSEWRSYSAGMRQLTSRGFIDGDTVELLLELPRQLQTRIFEILARSKTFYFPSLEALLNEVEELQRMH